MAKECPQRLQKHTAALATVTGEAFQGEQFQGNENAWLEAEMLGLRQLPNGLTLEVPITIDSGSNADFVGMQFIKQHRIALLPATLPLNVVTVDGRKLLGGQVVQQTPPMLLKIGNHREVISFNVTQLSDTPIVLGMSWLDRHSPSLAWYQRQLTFGSSYCAQHCIQIGQEEEGQEEGQQLHLGMVQ
ncbi:Hypothetical predicted protein, partial [Podarcis lilfordi]